MYLTYYARFPFHANPTPTTTPSRRLVRPPRSPAAKHTSLIEDIESDSDEENLVEDFGVEGAVAEEVLGYDPDNDEEDEDEDGDDKDGDDEDGDDEDGDEDEPALEGHSDEEPDLDDDTAFEELWKRIWVEATQRSEATHRAAGIKTQHTMIRAWEVCFHSLILFF